MTVKSKQALIKRQAKLMQERDLWEQMQTDYSYDDNFYRFCQWKMQMLDEEAELIRHHIIDMGCVE